MGSRGEITDGQGPFLTVDPYQAPFAASVRPEAAPFPVLGCCYKPALHGIAMHVPKLLDAFLRTGDVEIVKPLLPDRPRTDPAVVQQFCETLFDDFHHHGRIVFSNRRMSLKEA